MLNKFFWELFLFLLLTIDHRSWSWSTFLLWFGLHSTKCRVYENSHWKLAYSELSYYAWGSINRMPWTSPKKINGAPKSFAAASSILLPLPFTFGLRATFYSSENKHDSISNNDVSFIHLLNNEDSYDVEFVIDNNRILASKCFLKIASLYYSRMFSGDWLEKDCVIIKHYSYDTYYVLLRLLHGDDTKIHYENFYLSWLFNYQQPFHRNKSNKSLTIWFMSFILNISYYYLFSVVRIKAETTFLVWTWFS